MLKFHFSYYEKMEWHTEIRKISDLREYGKNPRILDKLQGEHLKKSIDRFGQCEPIVINPDGLIIGGHQRFRTMRKMGAKEVSVSVPEQTLGAKEIEELNIRLNKNVGEWDFDVLANEWDFENLLDWGFLDKELLDESSDEMVEKPTNFTMTIKCVDKNQLYAVVKRIDMLLCDYEGATYKVKKSL